MTWWKAAGAVVAILLVGLTSTASSNEIASATSAGSVASWCRAGSGVGDLDRMFDGDPGRIVGADYPRTLALPDGRVLWTFQDPVVTTPSGAIRNLHNAAVVQDGNCFELLRSGSLTDPRPWLLSELTTPELAWFWPLDMTLSADERTVHVFLVQMFEDGNGIYLDSATPNSVVVVSLDSTTLAVTGGPSTPSWGNLTGTDRTLYGWSAETAGTHTYLFGHCHRQFGFDPFFNDSFIHDTACSTQIRLARVPRGQVFAPPEYWTGSGWSERREAASSLLPPGRATVTQPTQFQFVNGRWMATTKIDDWWGRRIVIDDAEKVTGPWRQRSSIPVVPKCPRTETDPGCTTYFSSFVEVPDRAATDGVVVSLSHNRWDGVPRAEIYRPTYFTVDPPDARSALADRCSLDQC